MPRNVPLSDEARQAIKDLKAKSPALTLREIGNRFGVTPACVCVVISGRTYVSERKLPKRQKVAPPPPPKCSAVQPGSIISPITREQLMGGNARRAKSFAA